MCGNYGCLESYCSIPNVLKKAQEVVWFGESSYLRDISSRQGGIEFHHLLEGARMGDNTSLQILNQLGQYVGVGMVNLINLYDPEMALSLIHIYAAPYALFRDKLVDNLEFTAKGGFSAVSYTHLLFPCPICGASFPKVVYLLP